MEASSHGLDQRRLDGVRLEAGGFTNLGHDHLDYHETMDAYRQAKLRLFETLLPDDAAAVVNADGALRGAFSRSGGRPRPARPEHGPGRRHAEAGGRGARRLRPAPVGRCSSGRAPRPCRSTWRFPSSATSRPRTPSWRPGWCSPRRVTTRPRPVFAAFAHLKGVPGRLERVGEVRGALCIVDYAHKPDALEHVLDALRPFTSGRLVCVFGCGGDRDRGKRPVMGRIASERADIVIVTDDNPRGEQPAAIRAEILAGAPGAREIGDRAEAIGAAVAALRAGRCARGRRKRPRNRPDHRRPHPAVLGPRGPAGSHRTGAHG